LQRWANKIGEMLLHKWAAELFSISSDALRFFDGCGQRRVAIHDRGAR
jgi:hypothetical protein